MSENIIRPLNQSAIKQHALKCSQQIRAGKFERVSESFLNEIQIDVETLLRTLDAKYAPKVHGNLPIDAGSRFVTGQLMDKVQIVLDSAVARLIQRAVENHPGVGKTLQGKY